MSLGLNFFQGDNAKGGMRCAFPPYGLRALRAPLPGFLFIDFYFPIFYVARCKFFRGRHVQEDYEVMALIIRPGNINHCLNGFLLPNMS